MGKSRSKLDHLCLPIALFIYHDKCLINLPANSLSTQIKSKNSIRNALRIMIFKDFHPTALNTRGKQLSGVIHQRVNGSLSVWDWPSGRHSFLF